MSRPKRPDHHPCRSGGVRAGTAHTPVGGIGPRRACSRRATAPPPDLGVWQKGVHRDAKGNLIKLQKPIRNGNPSNNQLWLLLLYRASPCYRFPFRICYTLHVTSYLLLVTGSQPREVVGWPHAKAIPSVVPFHHYGRPWAGVARAGAYACGSEYGSYTSHVNS